MQGSKIRLSAAEMELFGNPEIILTKNSIVQKTILLLQEVQETLMNESSERGYHFSTSPKISKGENYEGLPFIILDYPRIAEEQNLFFIRSMFWWGNFFSSTLQFSGSFKKQYIGNLKEAYKPLSDASYFIGINNDPWVHHFEEDNYKEISSLTKEAFIIILEERPHIKIAVHWPLSDWDSAANKLIESWKFFMDLIKAE